MPAACGLITARAGLTFSSEALAHTWSSVSINASQIPQSGASASFSVGFLPHTFGGVTPSGAAKALIDASPLGAGNVSGIGADVVVTGLEDGFVRAWSSAGAGSHALTSIPLPAGCVSKGIASVDSLAVALNFDNLTLSLSCAGDAPSWSGRHNVDWAAWAGTSMELNGDEIHVATAAVMDGAWTAGGMSVSVDEWQVRSLLPHRVAPAQLWPITDGGAVDANHVSLGDAQRRNEMVLGIVDASLAPFHADPTGFYDSTAAINRAIAWAREHSLVTYLPVGNYSISDTIQLVAYGRNNPTNVYDPATGLLNHGAPTRPLPATLRGEANPGHPAAAATLVLRAGAPGFGDPTQPRFVVNMTNDEAASPGDPEHSQPNEVMNVAMTAVNVVVEEGNPGAIGVRLRAAQGSTTEDVTVTMHSGLFGVSGLPGSGGATVSLTVIGGQWGIDARGTQPQSTVTGLTMRGQQCGAIVSMSWQSLTLVGAAIVRDPSSPGMKGGIPAILQACNTTQAVGDADGACPNPVAFDSCFDGAWAGQLTMRDSVITTSWYEPADAPVPRAESNTTVAVWTQRSAVFENVWIADHATLVQATSQDANSPWPFNISLPSIANGPGLYDHLEMVVLPVTPPVLAWNKKTVPREMVNFTFPATVLAASSMGSGWNRSHGAVLNRSTSVIPPPISLTSHHTWHGAAFFPNFNWPGVVLAKEAVPDRPAATGDGITDDYPAIQAAIDEACSSPGGVVVLGRGVFVLSQGLTLHAGCALIGSSSPFTHLVMQPNRSASMPLDSKASSQPQYIISATAGAGQSSGNLPTPTTVAFLQVRVWQSQANTTSAIRVRVPDTAPPAQPFYGTSAGFFFRQAAAWTKDLCGGWFRLPNGGACPAPQVSQWPMLQITDAPATGPGTGLPWKLALFMVHFEDSIHEAASYRHVQVAALGAHIVEFYHLNTEHAESDANTEITDTNATVNINGMKVEGQYAALWVHALRPGADITLYGYGGNACPLPATDHYPPGFLQVPPSLMRIGTVLHPNPPSYSSHTDRASTVYSARVRLLNLMGFETPGTLTTTTSLRGPISCPRPVLTTDVLLVGASSDSTLATEPLERPSQLTVTITNMD
jgi:hypothetical protein